VIAPQAATPHPLGATLPGIYQDDALLQRLCAALDAVLAPDITMLDCFPAYLDPDTAPADLLDWMAGWVGLSAIRSLPLERRRELVGRAAGLHAWRGTPRAVKELIEKAAGYPAELEESGAAAWSLDAAARPPGRDRPGLVVRVRTGGARLDPVTTELLGQLLALVVPAHLPWRLDVTA
jgi:phage tail-like protein